MYISCLLILFAGVAIQYGHSESDCDPLALENGVVSIKPKGVIQMLHFECNPPYVLIGSRSTNCFAIGWLAKMPICASWMSHSACKERRRQYGSGWVVGPAHDHTTMQANGHFVRTKSTDCSINTCSAQLLSPVYPAELSKGACFQFWFFMFDNGLHTLKASVHLATITLNTTLSNNREFQIKSYGDTVWKKGSSDVPYMTEIFQIAIDAFGSASAGAGIASDDVKLMRGSECSAVSR